MSNCSQIKQEQFRQVKLRGRNSGKTAFMIIIDEDQENYCEISNGVSAASPWFSDGSSRVTSMYMQRIVEQQVQKQLSVVNSINSTIEQSTCSFSMSSSLPLTFPIMVPSQESGAQVELAPSKRVAMKTVCPLSLSQAQKRPMTRSTRCKSQYFYDQKNYANIPEIVDHCSFDFKKMLIKKCVSLRNREYIVLN